MLYVLLFNIEGKKELKKAIEYCNLFPDSKIKPYGVIGQVENREIDKKMHSIWMPEELFLIAWTMFQYDALKREEITPEDGVEYLKMHKKDKDCHMEIVSVID